MSPVLKQFSCLLLLVLVAIYLVDFRKHIRHATLSEVYALLLLYAREMILRHWLLVSLLVRSLVPLLVPLLVLLLVRSLVWLLVPLLVSLFVRSLSGSLFGSLSNWFGFLFRSLFAHLFGLVWFGSLFAPCKNVYTLGPISPNRCMHICIHITGNNIVMQNPIRIPGYNIMMRSFGRTRCA